MNPVNGSSFGRAGGLPRRYPGGIENASIFATIRGSMPNRRVASRRLVPSTHTPLAAAARQHPSIVPEQWRSSLLLASVAVPKLSRFIPHDPASARQIISGVCT